MSGVGAGKGSRCRGPEVLLMETISGPKPAEAVEGVQGGPSYVCRSPKSPEEPLVWEAQGTEPSPWANMGRGLFP